MALPLCPPAHSAITIGVFRNRLGNFLDFNAVGLLVFVAIGKILELRVQELYRNSKRVCPLLASPVFVRAGGSDRRVCCGSAGHHYAAPPALPGGVEFFCE